MKTIWLVFAGIENGSREDCSVFYERPHAFLDKADAEAFETSEEARLNVTKNEWDEVWTHMYSVEVQ